MGSAVTKRLEYYRPGLLLRIFDFFFGCHHDHLSRVFTIRKETYRVCFDCGKKFAYSLETMSLKRAGGNYEESHHPVHSVSCDSAVGSG
jgi:hypothetical protein